MINEDYIKRQINSIQLMIATITEIAPDIPKGCGGYARLALSPTQIIERVKELGRATGDIINAINRSRYAIDDFTLYTRGNELTEVDCSKCDNVDIIEKLTFADIKQLVIDHVNKGNKAQVFTDNDYDEASTRVFITMRSNKWIVITDFNGLMDAITYSADYSGVFYHINIDDNLV